MSMVVYHLNRDAFEDRAAYYSVAIDYYDDGWINRVKTAWDLGMYEKVAIVQSDDMNKVYELTNNIDRKWTENPGVFVVDKNGRHRSTSIGDILVCGKTGTRHVVSRNGFEVES